VNCSRSENPLLQVEGAVDMAENAAIPQDVIDRLKASTDQGVWKTALRERPPQPLLTAQIASRVELIHPVSKESGHGEVTGLDFLYQGI
jgi:hypothetical protein